MIRKEPANSHIAHDIEGLCNGAPTPPQVLVLVSSHRGDCQEASLPSSCSAPASCHGKVTSPRAGAWREVAREGPLLPRAFADVLLPASPRIPGCWPHANSCAKPTPCLFSPPPKWSPCLVNFFLVAYLEAVKTDPRGPSAVMVPYLIIFPKPDY